MPAVVSHCLCVCPFPAFIACVVHLWLMVDMYAHTHARIHIHASPFTLIYPPVSVLPDRVDMGDDLLSISIIDPPVSSHRLCLAVQVVNRPRNTPCSMPPFPSHQRQLQQSETKQTRKRKNTTRERERRGFKSLPGDVTAPLSVH